MVRLQPRTETAYQFQAFSLNSTMVRLQQGFVTLQGEFSLCSLNSTMVRLQLGFAPRFFASSSSVSIPLWFDYNFKTSLIP